MKFSKMSITRARHISSVKTGRKNIRILEPGEPYEKSFVVPLEEECRTRAGGRRAG